MFSTFSIPAFDYSEYFKAAAYAYYSFCLSFDKSMEKIRALNPDAEIVVMGIGNMLGELKLKVDVSGILTDGLDIGSLYGRLFVDRANNHMIEAAAANYNMDYVSAGDAERFMDEIAAYNGDPSTISSQFKEYCDYYEEDLMIKNAVDNKLKSFLANISSSTKKTEYKNNAYKAAYDTAASALSEVAKLTEAKLTTDTGMFILNYKDNISELSGIISDLEYSLLCGLRDKSADIAYNAKSGNPYKTSIKAYTTDEAVNGNPMMYNPEFSKNKNSYIFEIGRILFMIKIRVTMGNGFFQHPSANGHKQLSDMVMNACTGRIVKYPVHEQTCVQDGNDTEFWVDMASGNCYQDQAATTPINAVDLFTKAYGHSYGKTVTTVKPKYCTDGKGKQTCSKCGDVKIVAIPGLGPDAIKLSSVTAAKKAFTAKWKKPSSAKLKKMTGYQLRYSLKSSMASSKTVKVGKTLTSKKVSSLKAKKKYYVQIRTYVTKNGKTYYSDWSAKKTVKTK
jgi:hypothetical protein